MGVLPLKCQPHVAVGSLLCVRSVFYRQLSRQHRIPFSCACPRRRSQIDQNLRLRRDGFDKPENRFDFTLKSTHKPENKFDSTHKPENRFDSSHNFNNSACTPCFCFVRSFIPAFCYASCAMGVSDRNQQICLPLAGAVTVAVALPAGPRTGGRKREEILLVS